jgi:hypothetical protein
LRDADAARDFAHEFFTQVLAGGAIANAAAGTRAVPVVSAWRGEALSRTSPRVGHADSNAAAAWKAFPSTIPKRRVARTVPDASLLSPDAAFDRQWALTVVARALDALRL